MGESVTKGKKIRKESGFPFWIREVFFLEGDFFFFVKRHKNEEKEGIFLQSIWGVLWGRLIYIRER